MTQNNPQLPISPVPEVKPPRVPVRISAAPKAGQVYWCDFWLQAQLPEFWKTRPVIVVSYKNQLYGPCLVVPTTTDDQGGSPWAFPFVNLIGDGQKSWAVCNHLYTVAPSRLSQFKGRIPNVSQAQFNEILARINVWIPKIRLPT
jgi:mRNA interferase MazF